LGSGRGSRPAPRIYILTYKDGLGKPRVSKLNVFIGALRENQDIIGMMIFGGVFERNSRLKLVCGEAHAGWAPHYMSRIDHDVERNPRWLESVKLPRKPSEYFNKNVYMTFQDNVIALKLKDIFNNERIMWANDLPHLDATWPKSHELLEEQTAVLTREEKTKLLHDNVAELYKLDA